MFVSETVSAGPVPAARSAVAPAAAGRDTVLLVEDEAALHPLLAQVFERRHRRVLLATNAESALVLFDAHRDSIAAALVDCHLPDMQGAELCRRLRAAAPGVPLLLTSGRDQRPLASALARSGPTRFQPKPYLPSELAGGIDQLLGAA